MEPSFSAGVERNVWMRVPVAQIVLALAASVFLSLGTCSWLHAPVLSMLNIEQWKGIGWAGIALIGLAFARMGMGLVPLTLVGACGTWLGCGLATWLQPSHLRPTLIESLLDPISWFAREATVGAVTTLAAGLVVRAGKH